LGIFALREALDSPIASCRAIHALAAGRAGLPPRATCTTRAPPRTAADRRLQLGVSPSIAPYVPSKVLLARQQRYHHLWVEQREAETMTLLKELGRGALDVLMLVLPAANAEIETTIRLFDDSFLLLVPATERRKGPGFS
jgi:hypothetical protein